MICNAQVLHQIHPNTGRQKRRQESVMSTRATAERHVSRRHRRVGRERGRLAPSTGRRARCGVSGRRCGRRDDGGGRRYGGHLVVGRTMTPSAVTERRSRIRRRGERRKPVAMIGMVRTCSVRWRALSATAITAVGIFIRWHSSSATTLTTIVVGGSGAGGMLTLGRRVVMLRCARQLAHGWAMTIRIGRS